MELRGVSGAEFWLLNKGDSINYPFICKNTKIIKIKGKKERT
jgi:hypothetical protein